MSEHQYTIQGTELDAHFAAICLCLSQVIATAGEGNFNNIEERLKIVQEHVVKVMALLPQPMQDEIVEISRLALAHSAGG